MDGAYVPPARPAVDPAIAARRLSIARRQVLGNGAEATARADHLPAGRRSTPGAELIGASLSRGWCSRRADGAILLVLDLVAGRTSRPPASACSRRSAARRLEGGRFFLVDTSKQMFDGTDRRRPRRRAARSSSSTPPTAGPTRAAASPRIR
jgi:hypothetical protein